MTQYLRRAAALILFIFLPTGGFAQSQADTDVETLVRWVTGTFSNQQQIDDGLLDADSNLLFPVFQRVDVPAFGDQVVYLQWPIGAPEGRLQRQRIWSFKVIDGRLVMDFFTLKEPDKWRDAHIEPQKIFEMNNDDVIGYPEGCLLPVERRGGTFFAAIPSTCEIVSQETRITMTLEAEIEIGKDHITYREAGRRPDGTLVFQVPGEVAYEFQRLAN